MQNANTRKLAEQIKSQRILAITAGADISAVKEMLGHGSVTSTEVYAKVSLDKKIQAVNLTDGVFG